MSRVSDTHQDIDVSKLNTENWQRQKELTRDDYLIILGDWGVIWTDGPTEAKADKYWADWYEAKNFTTLVILGNHDCYPAYDRYPLIDFCGGKARQVREHVLVLQRGDYYTIDGTTFWCMSGARSHDIRDGVLDLSFEHDRNLYKMWKNDTTKLFRINRLEWWSEEIPNEEERQHGLDTLAEHDWKVDFILTHEAPAADVILASHGYYSPNEYSKWLDNEVRCKVDYKYWLFGHYHRDDAFSYRDICFYQRVRQIA